MHSPGGWVFRIENPATVSFLQSVGKPGHLTTVHVSTEIKMASPFGFFGELFRSEFWASVLFLIGVAATITVIVLLGVIRDWWALGVLGMLMGARVLNVCVIRLRQDKDGFKGKKEGDTQGDLLIVLSQDRWVRMRGGVDDIKEVTAGQWLREPETVESFAVSFATLLVYGSAALAGNTTTVGSLLLALLLLFCAGVLGLANAATRTLHMFDRVVAVSEGPKKYGCRLDMVKDMIQVTDREEWALNMGLITQSVLNDEVRRASTGTQDMTLVHRGSHSRLPIPSSGAPELPPGGTDLGINNGSNLELGLSGSGKSATSSATDVAELPRDI
ncbi:uncharacterized protein PHACADRAFT_253494, partial [Phanerochaete carnosa HHB-10118-sp]